ncbi:MAG: flagellar FliL protein [Bermanella sp.]|jgi:flagellar FliL protein
MNIKTILIIVAAQTVLIVCTVAGTWMLFLSTQTSLPVAIEGEAEVAKDRKAAALKKDTKDPIYYSVEPAFVVNLQGEGSSRFLQTQVELMSRDPVDFEKVEKYGVRIRNDLLMLFGSLTRDELILPDGKTNLQKSALATVNAVLKEESGKGSVEAVYFAKFVMQ